MKRKNNGFFIDYELYRSNAFKDLKPISVWVLLEFFTKRQLKKNSSGCWACINNGKIIFPYREAKNKLGLHSAQFTRAIDNLMEVGFIDLTHSGNGSGSQKDPSLYAISERWRKYGTSDFEKHEREKEDRKLGFQGNKKKAANSNIIDLASRK